MIVVRGKSGKVNKVERLLKESGEVNVLIIDCVGVNTLPLRQYARSYIGLSSKETPEDCMKIVIENRNLIMNHKVIVLLFHILYTSVEEGMLLDLHNMFPDSVVIITIQDDRFVDLITRYEFGEYKNWGPKRCINLSKILAK